MNNEEKLNNIINRARKVGSFFLTLTIRDKSRTEGDLTHFTYKEDFPHDDIIPSLDSCVRSLGIKQPDTERLSVKQPVLDESVDRKPLKIAILTHFNRCPDSYSPGKAVKNQIKMLTRYGHEVVFFTQEKSHLTKNDVNCEVRTVIPKFRREKGVINEEAKKKFIDVLREHLTSDFDLAITHDFYIEDCITYRAAIMECNVPIKWLHWARSGVGKPIDFSMPNARYVYMNHADSEIFASRINVPHDLIRVVFNEKDPRIIFHWNKITEKISDKMRLQEKDIIQTFPACTTRLDAKGIDSVIRVFGALKNLGNKVALIICNSNGKRRKEAIEAKLLLAKEYGLDENDILFTSTLSEVGCDTETEVPHDVVIQLMQISNLFVFPTLAEVCPNVMLEASMNKNLIVVNEDLKLLYDFVNPSAVLSFPFTSSQSLHYSGRKTEEIERLAKQIVGQIKSNKQDLQFRKVWRTHTMDNVYNTQLKNILYE